MEKILIFGNSGSGKSTLAKILCESINGIHLDLDTLAWEPGTTKPVRRILSDVTPEILDFSHENNRWVIEGCYADLLEVAMDAASAVIFLNPSIDTCISNAKNRPWEPHKYTSPEAQDANLSMLLEWIKDYYHRSDEFSYIAHRQLFQAFSGPKFEFTSNIQDPSSVVKLFTQLV